MEAKETTRKNPITYYWDIVRSMNDAQKLELMTLIIDSMKPVAVNKERMESEENSFRPYSMEEIDAMLDEAEADFDAGLGIPHEVVMRKWRGRVAREHELAMVKAV